MTELSISTTRVVTVLQTRGQKVVQIELPAEVTTFGQLKKYFQEAGVEYHIKHNVAIESVNNTTLELDDARLPEGDFKLGIFARKTKAGTDRKTLYSRIKEFVHRDGKDKVNNYFKEKAGAHYTNVPNDRLEALVNAYSGTEEITVEAEEESATPDVAIAELLSKMGVSKKLVKKVIKQIEGSSDLRQDWFEDICREHPLLDC